MVAHSVRLGVSTETRSLRQQTENLSRTVCIRQKSPTQQQKIDAGDKFITVCGNTKNYKRLKTWPAYQIRTFNLIYYCALPVNDFPVFNDRPSSNSRNGARTFAGTGVISSHFLRPTSPRMGPTVKLKARRGHQRSRESRTLAPISD
jgi:hypothetical protein